MDYLNQNIKKSKIWAQFAAIMFLIFTALTSLENINSDIPLAQIIWELAAPTVSTVIPS